MDRLVANMDLVVGKVELVEVLAATELAASVDVVSDCVLLVAV